MLLLCSWRVCAVVAAASWALVEQVGEAAAQAVAATGCVVVASAVPMPQRAGIATAAGAVAGVGVGTVAVVGGAGGVGGWNGEGATGLGRRCCRVRGCVRCGVAGGGAAVAGVLSVAVG